MKTIKLIDLFIKIAKGEDTPEKIEFQGKIYSHNGCDNRYYYCKENDKLLEDAFIFEELNENVEIIEDTPKEDKKYIEHIKMQENELHNHLNIIDKLNEIIDKINGGNND